MRFNDKLSLDVAAFDNFYDHLQTNEPAGARHARAGSAGYLIMPAVEGNRMKGENSRRLVRGELAAA